MRRSFDVLAALLGLVLLSPILILIAAAILIEGHGPVFYQARRVGLHGRIFRLYKFRTMVPDADKMGAGITSADDKRITRIGHLLRHYKLDELPQLLNIIKGDMNLVGPRPEDPRYIRLYTEPQYEIFSVRPGITSPASLYYRNESKMLCGNNWEDVYITQVMPAKLSIDLEYFRQNTFTTDFGIVIKTVVEVFHLHPDRNSLTVASMIITMLLPVETGAQNRVLPLEHQLATRLGPRLYSPDTRVHTSIQPYDLSDFSDADSYDALFFEGGRAYRHPMPGDSSASLFTRKLFNEHLYDAREADYTLAIDVLPDAHLGRDVKERYQVWSNTRDFLFEGSIGNTFSFRSEYFESQSRFPSYIDSFIGTNFVVPGQGYKRAYGSTAHDYGYATGHISYAPSKYFNFQFGHGKNFIGDGYRSMLLSDGAFDYPYLKISTKFWKLKYVNLWAQFQDVGRTKHEFDRAFTKKFGVFHYLDINITDRLALGLFEAIIWRNSDSLGYRGFDLNYLNPIIFFNPIEFSLGSPDNSLIGVNFRYRIFSHSAVYAQLMLDELSAMEYVKNRGYWANKYGIQFGVKTFSLFGIPELSLQTEFNMASPYTYSHFDPVTNYGHYNQSLAHPLGANFYESVSIAQYALDRFEFRAQFNTARYGSDPPDENFGGNIFKPYTTRMQDYGNYTGQGRSSHVYYADARVGYVFNPLTNLRLELGAAWRRQTTEASKDESMVLMLGVRGSFRNIYYDF
ncbi:MAG TPA: sugar transferase [Bacteroidota bacterium]|nr:sugar transferase [Bacteroidota bacterium]